LGEATEARQLTVNDPLFENKAVDMPMQVMLGGTPRMSVRMKRLNVKAMTLMHLKLQI
jgi:phosphoribosylformylglycinamidine (FGAM) synthase-like enzyme